jgi:hypothetical protein
MKKTNKQIIKELRDLRDSAAFFDLYFAASPLNLSRKDRRFIEAHVKQQFIHWWNSWVRPDLNELEHRLIRKSRRK